MNQIIATKLTVDECSNLLVRIKKDLSEKCISWNMFDYSKHMEQYLKEIYSNSFEENIIQKCARILQKEHEEYLNDPGVYVWDTETGRNLFKLTESMIMVSDDKPQEIKSRLHPRVTSGLIMYKHEYSRIASLKSGKYASHVRHLLNPDLILSRTRELLRPDLKVVTDEYLPDLKQFVVGKEHRHSTLENLGRDFDKLENMANRLANYLNSLPISKVKFVSIIRDSDYRDAWYEVRVSTQ